VHAGVYGNLAAEVVLKLLLSHRAGGVIRQQLGEALHDIARPFRRSWQWSAWRCRESGKLAGTLIPMASPVSQQAIVPQAIAESLVALLASRRLFDCWVIRRCDDKRQLP